MLCRPFLVGWAGLGEMRLRAAFSSLAGTSAGAECSQASYDFSSPLFSHPDQAVQGTLQTKSGPQVPPGTAAKHGPLSCLSSIDSPDLLLTLQACYVLGTQNLLSIRS